MAYYTQVFGVILTVLVANVISETDICFEVKRNDTLYESYLHDGDIVDLFIGVHSMHQFVCNQSGLDSPGVYAAIYRINCSNACNSTKSPINITSNPNIEEYKCGNNCHAYTIYPSIEQCIRLECERGTNRRSIRKCVIYVTIQYPPLITAADAETTSESVKQTSINILGVSLGFISVILVMIFMIIFLVCLFVIKTRNSKVLAHENPEVHDEDAYGTANTNTNLHHQLVTVQQNKSSRVDGKEITTEIATGITNNSKIVLKRYMPIIQTQRSDKIDASDKEEELPHVNRSHVSMPNESIDPQIDENKKRHYQETDQGLEQHLFISQDGKQQFNTPNKAASSTTSFVPDTSKKSGTEL